MQMKPLAASLTALASVIALAAPALAQDAAPAECQVKEFAMGLR